MQDSHTILMKHSNSSKTVFEIAKCQIKGFKGNQSIILSKLIGDGGSKRQQNYKA